MSIKIKYNSTEYPIIVDIQNCETNVEAINYKYDKKRGPKPKKKEIIIKEPKINEPIKEEKLKIPRLKINKNNI
jgi:hypothetical protein